MSAAGLLRVRAHARAESGLPLEVNLQRPPAARLFIGQAPETVVKTVPYLFSLCAEAQRAAAQCALTAAGAIAARPVDAAALWLEFIHESLWRFLLDWPTALGLPAAQAAFAEWRMQRHGPAAGERTRRLFHEIVLPLADSCLCQLGASGAGALAEAEAEAPKLAPDAWLAYWRGEAAHMPAPRPVLAVAAAYQRRLAELAGAIRQWSAGEACPMATAGDSGSGIAQVWTARGVLTHAVRVADGRVSDYRVWAPTDVHFADAGALSAVLAASAWPAPVTQRQRLERAILALDPCLPYVVELEDA